MRLPVAVEEGEANIEIVDLTDNTIEINLTNNVPVRVVSFIINGMEITKVHNTTRTERFYVKYNKKNDKVTILSTSKEVISPGTGSIAEIISDKKSSASLADIKILK